MALQNGDTDARERDWTATGDALLIQLITERFALREICAILKRSEASVRERAAYLCSNAARLRALTGMVTAAGSADTAWPSKHGVHRSKVNFR
jgi:hypothetical protein